MGLKADLARTDTISQIVSVHDALAARIANDYAFDWLSVGGYNNVSGSAFGMPNIGLLTLTEQVEAVRRIANVATAPIRSPTATTATGTTSTSCVSSVRCSTRGPRPSTPRTRCCPRSAATWQASGSSRRPTS